MAASRATKLILGALFVLSFILTAGYPLLAAQVQSGENPEPIPTPIPMENNGAIDTTAETITNGSEICDDSGCSYCGVPLCSPPGRFWIRADWLMWWTNGEHLPPLVTSSPQGTPQGQAGVLGQPGTTILFGNSTVYDDGRAGVRIAFGGWLDACHRWGLEADWLTLGGRSINYSQTSNGDPILARPFFNVQTNAQDSQLKAYPNVVTGTVDVVGNDYFESVGMDLRYNLCCNSCGDICQESCDSECGGACCSPCCLYYCRTDLLAGYRHYLLGDNLSVDEDIFDNRVQSRFQITDTFNARNEFNGAEIGLNTELRRGRWSLGLLAKIAAGNNHETVYINGTTTVTTGSQVEVRQGGIYALQTNSGTHTSDEFVVIPQFGVEMGCQVTCRLRTFVGYNLLYWAPVLRAGDQIDLNIDPRNFPCPDYRCFALPGLSGESNEFLGSRHQRGYGIKILKGQELITTESRRSPSRVGKIGKNVNKPTGCDPWA